jgi:hypothetical protein
MDDPSHQCTGMHAVVCSLTGSEVVHVSSQQDSDGEEGSNGNCGGLGLRGGRCSDDSVLSDDLDSLDVRAGGFVGVVDVHLALALSGNLVNVTAELADSAVVATAGAGHGNHGVLGVRKTLDGVLRLGEAGARIVSEQTKTDFSTLVGAVGTHVVRDVLIAVVPVITLVVLEVTAHVELSARHVGAHVVAVVVAVVVALKGTASVGRVVGSQVGLHVHDVVSVVRGAATQVAAALSGGAESEAGQALGHDADIVLIRGVLVPLLNVVASLELDAVCREEASVGAVVTIIFVVVPVVQFTGVVHQVASSVGVHGNISILLVDNRALGGGEETQSDDGDTREHGASLISTIKLC